MVIKRKVYLFIGLLLTLFIVPRVQAANNDYKYTVLSDGTIQIDEYTGTSANITIPSQIDNKTVSTIGRIAFAQKTNLVSVTIPNSIKEIGIAAFADSTNLKTINFGTGLTTIKDYAFQNTKIANISFPSSLTTIGSYIFYGNSSITSLNIPKNVKTIGNIGYNATSLISITVDSNNAYLSAMDGVLFDKNKTLLITYPPAKKDASYTIPSTVKVLGDYSFSYTAYLSKINIPSSVVELKDGVFLQNKLITDITIPSTLTKFGNFAFQEMVSLKKAIINSNLEETGYRMFSDLNKLETVEFNGKIKNVVNRTFYKVPNLKTVTFNGSVNTVYAYAFSNCTSLQKIVFPNDVSYFGPNFLYECNKSVQYNIPSTLTKNADGSYSKIFKVTVTNGTYNYDYAKEVFNILNKERTANKLQTLNFDSALTEEAMQRAKEISIYFDHVRPNGLQALNTIPNANGENIAFGYANPTAVMAGWMASPGHKSNILYKDFKTVGIGVYLGPDNRYYWVQVFSVNSKYTNVTKSGKQKLGPSTIDVSANNITNFDITRSKLTYNKNEKNTPTSCKLENGGYSGAYMPISCSDFTWNSSNKDVFTVDKNGTITAVGGGSATLEATLGNITKKYTIKVIDYSIKSVQLDRTKVTLEVGDNTTLKATIEPSNTTDSKVLTYKSNNDAVATVDGNGKIVAKGVGSAIITVTTSNGKTAQCTVTVVAQKPHVTYRTHVQKQGWQAYVRDGVMAGTSGKSLRLEAINIKLENASYSGGIEYRTHVQKQGWETKWASNGALSGTSGKSLRLEAIQIRLTGEMAKHYDIYYRVHAQNFGWLDWAKNGEKAGTAGYSYRLEGIEIKLVPIGDSAPGKTTKPFTQRYISYQTHVQKQGWQAYKYDGATSGTSGKSLRLEGIKIELKGQEYSGGIEYRTHIQRKGWETKWVSNGALSGTSGKSLRLEAIQIKLTGEMAKHYDVYYRVHAQYFGWLDWAKNGESAGTAGYGYRLEAIQIKLVPKNSKAPGSTTNHFKEK